MPSVVTDKATRSSTIVSHSRRSTDFTYESRISKMCLFYLPRMNRIAEAGTSFFSGKIVFIYYPVLSLKGMRSRNPLSYGVPGMQVVRTASGTVINIKL